MATAVNIIMDGTDESDPLLQKGKYVDRLPPDMHLLNSGELSIVGMPEGTSGGKTSVMILLDDGEKLALAETTLSLFLTAADALRAYHHR